MSSTTSFIERKKKSNITRSIKHTKTFLNIKIDPELAKKADATQKKKEKLYVHPDHPTITEDQIKMLSNYLKMTHFVDNEIITHKSVEEKQEIKQKKQEKVHSDDEESLKNILKELEKDKMPNNPIYFVNNEEIKYRAKNNRKKNNKYKNISLQNMEYRITQESEETGTPGSIGGKKPARGNDMGDLENEPTTARMNTQSEGSGNCYIF
jgi:hypothetical protein